MRRDRPLWMPIGSVRGILAIGMSAAAVAAVFVLGVEVAAPLLAIDGVIINSYFEQRRTAR